MLPSTSLSPHSWSDPKRSSILDSSDPPSFRKSLEENPYLESVASTNEAASPSFDRALL